MMKLITILTIASSLAWAVPPTPVKASSDKQVSSGISQIKDVQGQVKVLNDSTSSLSQDSSANLAPSDIKDSTGTLDSTSNNSQQEDTLKVERLPQDSGIVYDPIKDTATTYMLLSPGNRKKIFTSAFVTGNDQALMKVYYDMRDSMKTTIQRGDLVAFEKSFNRGQEALAGFDWMYNKEKALTFLVLGRAEEIYKDSVMRNQLMANKISWNSSQPFCGLAKPVPTDIGSLSQGATQDMDFYLWKYFEENRMEIARRFHKEADIHWILTETQCITGKAGKISPTQENQLREFVKKFPKSEFLSHAQSWIEEDKSWNGGGFFVSFGPHYTDFIDQPNRPLVSRGVSGGFQITGNAGSLVFGMIAHFNSFKSGSSVRFTDTTLLNQESLELNTYQFMTGIPMMPFKNMLITPYGAVGTTTLKTASDFHTESRGTWLPKYSQLALGAGVNVDYLFSHMMSTFERNSDSAGSVGLRFSFHYDYHNFSDVVVNMSDETITTKVELIMGIIGLE